MTPPPSEPIDATPPEDAGRAWPWLLALAASGAWIAVLPHLVYAARTGDPTFIADGDALLYLAWSRDVVRHGGLAMTDAVHRPSGPMMHPWLLFVPTARIAHAMGLGILQLGIVWRLIAGPAIALGLYAVARPFTKTARGAAWLTAFLLFDSGLIYGQLVVRGVSHLAQSLAGGRDLLGKVPHWMPHFRVPTPGLAMPFFLAHIALAHRARRRGTAGSALAAGVSLGLLFHVYFYFATAATLGTILAWFLDREGRRAYGRMLVVAAVVGGPALYEGARVKRSTPPDWLVRTDKFARIDRLARRYLLIPKVLIAEWLVAAWFVFRGRRELIYLWCCTLAGLALANQHLVTGFQLENFHWSAASGTTFSLLLTLLLLPGFARWGAWRRVAPALLGAQVVLGSYLRVVESFEATETRWVMGTLDQWRRDGFSIQPGSVVAGPPPLLLLLGAVEDVDVLGGRLVDYSSSTIDRERDERDAVALVLMGLSREEYVREAARMELLPATSREGRLDLYDKIRADPGKYVDRYRVSALVVPRAPSGLRPPPGLGDRARLVQEGATWDLWRIDPPPVVAAP